MTLTLKTAKHVVGRYGKILDIVDDADPLSAYSVTREEAIEANKLEYELTPCIVVTTAREALDAAWELAYETDRIPANTPYIYRTSDNVTRTSEGRTVDLYAGHGRSRLIDSPEPETWELSTYCYANGHIYERVCGTGTVYWVRPGSEIRYYREYFAPLSPRPLDLE